MSPRVCRVIALPAPSDREKTQMCIQRHPAHFPAAGEIVIFDRRWYNRAGVEHVMSFSTDKDYRRFLEVCPLFEPLTTCHGARGVSVASNIASRAREYSYHLARDGRSMALKFH